VRLRVRRREHIAFDAPVREHHLEWRCAPWDDTGQRLRRLDLACTPAAQLASHRDCFGNQVHRTALLGAHDGLVLEMDAEVETLREDPFAFEPVAPEREREWLGNALREAPRLWDLVLHRNAASPLLEALLAGEPPAALGVDASVAEGLPILRAGTPLFAQLQDLNSWIAAACSAPGGAGEYHDAGADAAPTADRPLRRGTGSAAELALLLVAVARAWGLPARLVSGYRFEQGSAAPAADAPQHDTAQANTALHHWAELLVPGAGWRGFDPVLGRVVDNAYVRQSVGRDISDLGGLRQSWKGDGRTDAGRTEVQVERIS
jgi:transglutaminase-like putative cysteine protease